MLVNSNRDYRLKQRILSNIGHLSNDECAKIIKEIINDNTKCIVLAHLSEECNTQDLAKHQVMKEIEKSNLKPTLYIAKQNSSIEVNWEKNCA